MIYALLVPLVITLYFVSCIKILNEYERGVIFRLGRLITPEKGPGLVLVFWPFDRMVKVSLRIIVMELSWGVKWRVTSAVLAMVPW